MDYFTNIKKEKIALLGLGIENQSLLKILLKKYPQADITICDKRSEPEIKKILKANRIGKQTKLQLGKNFNVGLEKFSLLFRSPGWPISCPGVQEAIIAGSKLSSPMNFFFATCPSKNIIGVTGSKGKGTTASLIFSILKKNNTKCFLGGNIGIAPLGFIDKIKKNDFVVLELSSFQLEDLNYSPHIAVITNIFKEHLSPADPQNPNFHQSYHSYIGAKMNIAAQQKKGDFLIINNKNEKLLSKYKTSNKLITFGRSKTKSSLLGDFNQENVAAAEAVVQILKIKKEIAEDAIGKFSNLEHRLELTRTIGGVNYYNNSFSTTPESTIADLKSFKKNIILLAGGADKGADFKKLAQEIKKTTKLAIFFPGKGSEKIIKELKKTNFPPRKIKRASNMETAINIAKNNATENDNVLLSTACASFGTFKNYKERGKLFQKEVKKI